MIDYNVCNSFVKCKLVEAVQLSKFVSDGCVRLTAYCNHIAASNINMMTSQHFVILIWETTQLCQWLTESKRVKNTQPLKIRLHLTYNGLVLARGDYWKFKVFVLAARRSQSGLYQRFYIGIDISNAVLKSEQRLMTYLHQLIHFFFYLVLLSKITKNVSGGCPSMCNALWPDQNHPPENGSGGCSRTGRNSAHA